MTQAFDLIFCLTQLWFLMALFSQKPILIKQCAIPSKIIHDSIRFGIMATSSQEISNRQYPVIYYLDGLRDGYTGSIAQKIAESHHQPNKLILPGKMVFRLK
jgi:predicted alpha/beta superfamily hydrolase